MYAVHSTAPTDAVLPHVNVAAMVLEMVDYISIKGNLRPWPLFLSPVIAVRKMGIPISTSIPCIPRT
jgi:hypothetical protein